MFGWDVYRNVLRPGADDKTVLRVSQATTIGAGILTVFLAVKPPDYLAFLIWLGIGIMLATFAVPLLAGMYWRRATREGALAAMACGLGSAVVVGGLSFFKILTYPIHFSFYALVISAFAMVAVSLATRPTEKKILDETLTGWFIQPR
ncbi:MAG: hypothetical protein LUQ41_00455 [Methanomicrobiales archaeon]|nr:hypothetical protein [Methanomicrobiales archaeon]